MEGGAEANEKTREKSTAQKMLEARNARKQAENDMQLLANRLAHLKAAEERARKKIAETKRRTREIVGFKKRNLDQQQCKSHLHAEQEVLRSTSQKNASAMRHAARRQVEQSRQTVVLSRQKAAAKQRESLKELTKVTGDQRAVAAERNRQRNETIRNRREELKRRKDAENADKERRRKVEYERRLALEAARHEETEKLIAGMAEEEAKMIDRLRATQDLQRQAYEELQTSLNL